MTGVFGSNVSLPSSSGCVTGPGGMRSSDGTPKTHSFGSGSLLTFWLIFARTGVTFSTSFPLPAGALLGTFFVACWTG
ncbi:hypothetical protein BD309DRAFT_966257 [Dichomitus squalens]|nr:hypothetical protein BD309DRAFT_966257 [Dichomitus squalens]